MYKQCNSAILSILFSNFKECEKLSKYMLQHDFLHIKD